MEQETNTHEIRQMERYGTHGSQNRSMREATAHFGGLPARRSPVELVREELFDARIQVGLQGGLPMTRFHHRELKRALRQNTG